MYKVRHTTVYTQQMMFDAVCAWLIEIGWVVYDDISPSSKVFTTEGETPKHLPIYVHLYIFSSYINNYTYGSWDNTTHVGSHILTQTNMLNRTFDTNSINASQNVISMFMSGSKDYCVIVAFEYINALAVYTDTFGFGYIPNILCEMCYTNISAVTPGSNVVLPLSSVANIQTGASYQIMDRTGVNGCELVKVLSIDVGNTTVTVETVTRVYSSGIFFGYNYFPVFRLSSVYIDMVSPTNKVGTNISIKRAYFNDIINGENDDTAPADGGSSMFPNTSKLLNTPVIREQNEIIPIGTFDNNQKSMRGSLTRVLGKTLIVYNNDGVQPTTSYPTDVSGDFTVVTDVRKNYAVNSLVGKYIAIVTGYGASQSRQIISNTATSVTILNPFIDPVNKTSQYIIVDHVFRSTMAWGGSNAGNFFTRDIF